MNYMELVWILWMESSLEPEVHIVDRYMQPVKKCFTMTNVMLGGNKEIDLLAFNPRTGEKYHIEVRVATGRGFRLRIVDTQTKKGYKHRRGLDTLHKIKFEPQIVVNSVKEILGHKNINNTLIYISLEAALFNPTNDEFTVRVAKNVKEACALIEAGFEYVTGEYHDGGKLFRKRK